LKTKKIHILKTKVSSRMGDGIPLDSLCGKAKRPWTKMRHLYDDKICKNCRRIFEGKNGLKVVWKQAK